RRFSRPVVDVRVVPAEGDCMRAFRLALFAAWPASGASCAPSRAYLFDPVEQTVRERTGLAPEWRLGGPPAPAVERRIRELLARPLTDENAALVAVLASPRLQAD